MTTKRCTVFGYSSSECDCEHPEYIEDIDIDEMKRKHPGHNDDAYNTGKMLGVDFPYVPGDPFW